jgi:hypothetical protein
MVARTHQARHHSSRRTQPIFLVNSIGLVRREHSDLDRGEKSLHYSQYSYKPGRGPANAGIFTEFLLIFTAFLLIPIFTNFFLIRTGQTGEKSRVGRVRQGKVWVGSGQTKSDW